MDASVAIKWVLPEEYSASARQLLSRNRDLLAPDLIWTESGNVLWKKWRRAELSEQVAGSIFQDLCRFPLRIYSSEALLAATWEIACSSGRSFYDSAYLALAASQQCPMVTADRKLYNAVQGRPSLVDILWVEDIN